MKIRVLYIIKCTLFLMFVAPASAKTTVTILPPAGTSIVDKSTGRAHVVSGAWRPRNVRIA